MSHGTTGSASGIADMDGGPFVAVGGTALLFNIVGLYAFPGVALCVFGYIALTLVLLSFAGRTTKNESSSEAGNGVLVLSWVVALIGGALVGGLHWVQFAPAAYAVLGVYTLAVVIWLIGRAYSALWSWLFPLVGVAMLTAIMQLGAPPGSDDMEDKESWTPVTVTAVDEAGEPIEGATVYLDLVQVWEGDPELEGDREWWSKGTTQSDGTARLDLQEDPRFKRLLIRVRHEPFTGGFNEPTTIGGYTGYEDARLQTTLPAPKVPYSFQVVMTQRSHPDSALLAVELKSPDSSEPTDSRSLKLALTTESDLPGHENGGAFDEDTVIDHGRVRDLYLSGSQGLVFKLSHELASRPLTLHVLERDSSRYDEAYVELQKISIDAIPLGNNRSLPTLTLPGRTSVSGSQTIAEEIRNTEQR